MADSTTVDTTMVKGPVPDWIADMFGKIDKKDLKGASAYFTDDCDSYFTHFHCFPGGEGFVKLVATFDSQFKEYHHQLAECWDGPECVMFGGMVSFTLPDGTVVGTPYWNRFYKVPGQKKIAKAFFMGSIGGLEEKYWKHLSSLAQAK
jgi:hypothetical protein